MKRTHVLGASLAAGVLLGALVLALMSTPSIDSVEHVPALTPPPAPAVETAAPAEPLVQAKSAKAEAVLEGWVIDLDQAPVESATIRIEADERRHRFETDEDGYFVLPVKWTGSYRITAEADFLLYERDVDLPRTVTETVNIDSLDAIPGIVLSMKGRVGDVLAGTVIDQDGAPVEGARVSVSPSRKDFTRRVQTDEAGRFRVQGLRPADRVEVVATKANVGTAKVSGVASDDPDVLLQFMPPGRFVGRVTTVWGGVIDEFDVALLPGGRGHVPDFGHLFDLVRADFSPRKDPEGRFDLDNLTAAAYGVGVRAEGFAPMFKAVATIFGGETDEQLFELEPESRITGTVSLVDGTPVDAATVSVHVPSDLGSLRDRLPRVQTDSQGRYELGGLPPGEYQVAARSADTRQQIVQVSVPARATATADFVLAPGGVIEGQLYRAHTAASGSITLSTRPLRRPPTPHLSSSIILSNTPASFEDPPAHGYSETIGTRTGAFRFEGLPPGTYHYFAALHPHPEGRGDTIRDAAALTMAGWGEASQAASVSLGPGETVILDLEFDVASAVSGRVTHGGQPIAGAQLTLYVLGTDSGTRFSATSGGDGTFSFDGTPSGTGRLEVSARSPLLPNGRGTLVREFTIPHGVEIEQSIGFEQSGGFVAMLSPSDQQRESWGTSQFFVLRGSVDLNAPLPVIGELGHVLSLDLGYTDTNYVAFAETLDPGEYQLVGVNRNREIIFGPERFTIRPGEMARLDF